jgi:hypothetical protein
MQEGRLVASSREESHVVGYYVIHPRVLIGSGTYLPTF